MLDNQNSTATDSIQKGDIKTTLKESLMQQILKELCLYLMHVQTSPLMPAEWQYVQILNDVLKYTEFLGQRL